MRIKSHSILAIIVLVAAGAWVATGKFSSVGSAAGQETSPEAQKTAATAETTTKQGQTVAYTVAAPTDYKRSFRVSGKTKPDKQTVVAARTSGTVIKLPVNEGDRVAKGDLIMAVEGPEKYTAVEAAKSLLSQRQHQAEVNSQLFERGKISSLANDESQAALSAARSSLEAAKTEVDKLELRAPFAGVIDKVDIEEGSWVTPGNPVASLLALDPIVAVGEISERDLGQVAVGNSAHVTFGDGVEADGNIRYIRREASPQTLTFPVEVAVPNPDGKISAGMSAAIRLDAKPVSAVVLPRSVVTLDAEGRIGVQTLADGDTVHFMPVTLIDDTPKGLVLGGIPAGTKVIVSGQDLVKDGQHVDAKKVATITGAGD